ncbi:MAG: TonB-dependent receptor [Halioglobus sp.]|nr:TonB-dependent receptor [Halioglobus sp.]
MMLPNKRTLCPALVCAAAGMGGLAPVSLAQEAKSAALEEIIVTAQRRAESLQKAPLSLTAFSADTIEELGILDVEGLTKFAPNVTVNKLPGTGASATVRIRGVANPEVILTTDPKVTLYLDGVLIAKAAGSMLDLIDLERIEVLRGPQGTLFGRNAVGGAIAVHSKEPTNEWDFRQNFDIGNLGLFESQTMVNVPLVDTDAGTLAARAVYMYRERDGWAEDEQGNDWGIEDRNAGRVSLAWTSPDWGARYTYDRTRWREKNPPAFLGAVGEFEPGSGTPKSDGLAAIVTSRVATILEEMGRPERSLDEFVQNGRSRTVPGEFIGDEDLDVTGHSLTLDRDLQAVPLLGDVTLKSITAYRETENPSLVELDGTPIAITFFESSKQKIEQFTQEFQLVGNTLEERLDYVFGLYWFDEEGELDSFNQIYDFTSVGDPGPLNEIDTMVTVDNQAWAAFGQGTLADLFTEGLNLTLGLRYTEEDRGAGIDRFESRFGTPQLANCDPALPDEFDPANCLSFNVDQSKEFDNISWMANLSYEWNDDHMSYLRVATGYQSGGFNGRALSLFAARTPFEEETAISYEVGMKSTFWQQRAKANWALFYTDTDDLQTAGLPPESDAQNVGTVVRNAGASTSYGAELELRALLTPDLDAYFNFAYIQNEFDEKVVGFDDVDGDGIRETPVDKSDDKFIQTPDYSVVTGLRYTFGDTGFGNLWARVDVSWKDDILFQGGSAVQTVNAPELNQFSAQDRPINTQNEYALIDAMITLERIPLVTDGNLRVSLWGKNITDKQYRYATLDLLENLGFLSTQYGDPRTWGITLSYGL